MCKCLGYEEPQQGRNGGAHPAQACQFLSAAEILSDRQQEPKAQLKVNATLAHVAHLRCSQSEISGRWYEMVSRTDSGREAGAKNAVAPRTYQSHPKEL